MIGIGKVKSIAPVMIFIIVAVERTMVLTKIEEILAITAIMLLIGIYAVAVKLTAPGPKTISTIEVLFP